jgi:pyruvate kinase
MAGEPNVFALAGDSDGIDGTEDAAGAIVTPDTLARARAVSLDPRATSPHTTVSVSSMGSATSFAPARQALTPLPHPEIFKAVTPGDDLLIDDGRVRIRVTGLGDDYIDAKVVIGGAISNCKGVNVPSAVLDPSPLTAKDRADLAFGLKLGVDWIALSFV